MDVTKQTLDIAIKMAAPGIKWSQIAARCRIMVSRQAFLWYEEFVGHGIGKEMHEEPKVPNFVSKELLETISCLQEGMVLAVEPMVNMGSQAVRTLKDGWTVVTRDGKCSAHFEHTIAIVKMAVKC